MKSDRITQNIHKMQNQEIHVVSVRECQCGVKEAIAYFQKHWATEASEMVYEDCILSSLTSDSPLPQWYLLLKNDRIIGCAGLITNDFISRMDLWPWLCSLYIEEDHRGHGYGKILIEKIKKDAKKLGFRSIYLCTDMLGYYEHYGFEKIASGYHPWGESTSIYEAKLKNSPKRISKMETQLLRDKDTFPDGEVLQKAMGKRYAAYKELIDTITGEDYGLTLEWRFYNDGKAWLGKALFGKIASKKKTIFWLSVWDGFFRIGFYFTEKTRGGVMDLNIDDGIKADFAKAEATGKLVPLSLKIDKKRQLRDVLEIVKYKKSLK